MSRLSFSIPGQPQGKGRARIVKRGQHYGMATPSKALAYEGLVSHCAAQAMAGAALIDGPVACRVLALFAVPASWSKKKRDAALSGDLYPTTKPDIDNIEKAVFDGCNGVVWRDDVQVVKQFSYKQYSDKPAVIVDVWPACEEFGDGD